MEEGTSRFAAQGRKTLEAMLQYASYGWHVFPQHFPLTPEEEEKEGLRCSCRDINCPLAKAGKHPMADSPSGAKMLQGGFTGGTTDPEEIRRWVQLEPRINVGITTGQVSGLVVLDFDRAQGARDCEELDEAHPGWRDAVPTVKTGNGLHLYFAHPGEGLIIPTYAKVLRPGTDLRGDGGCITAPPSTHGTRRQYYWTVPVDRSGKLPVLPDWVLTQISEREEDRKHHQRAASARMEDPAIFNTEEKLRQCERYMTKVAPAVEGQGGDDHTYKVACLGGDFDLSDDEFWPIFARWNDTCRPPWSDKDLRNKLKSAEKNRRNPRGIKLRRVRPRTVAEAPRGDGPRPWNDPRPEEIEPLEPVTPRLRASEAPLGLGAPYAAQQILVRDGLLIQDFLDGDYLADDLAGDGHPLSTRGNASRFCGEFGGRVKYCAVTKLWYVWTGTHWEIDRINAVFNLSAQVMARMHRMLREDFYTPLPRDGEETVKAKKRRRAALVKHIVKSEQPKEIKPAIEYASWQRSVAVLPEQLDRDDHLLNTPSCVVDIRDLCMYSHDPALLQSKITSVGYDKRAECPEWEEFLLWAMEGNVELVRFLQRAAGMSLTGYAREHCFLVLYGTGGNGKSTFVNCLKHIAYKYARVFPFDMFLSSARDNGSTPNEELLALKDVRVAFASEPNENKSINESRIKSITGGDPISARPLYGRPIEFEPKFTLWLSCNHRPVIKGTDEGIWRRVMLVPFTAQITAETKDTGKQERMLDREAEGILGWALEGARDWYRDGLRPPPAVREAVDEYRDDMDTLGKFVQQCCISNGSVSCKSSDLYREYESWADDEGERFKMSHKRLTQKLKERGIEVEKYRDGNRYIGIALRYARTGQ